MTGKPRRKKILEAIPGLSEVVSDSMYTIGTALTAVHEFRHQQFMSGAMNLSFTLAWNYLDGLASVALGISQLFDQKNHRQKQIKIRGVLNIIVGVQLFAFSYNPALTAALGIAGGAALASTSLVLATLCELVNACLDFYDAWKEQTVTGWLEEKIHEHNYLCSLLKTEATEAQNKEIDSLNALIFARARVYLLKNTAKNQKITALLCQLKQKNTDEHYTPETVNSLLRSSLTANDRQTDYNADYTAQAEANENFRQAKLNLAIKTLSFIGMTLLAIAPLFALGPASIPIIVGLTLTLIVAACYLLSNADKVKQQVHNFGFFKKKPEPPKSTQLGFESDTKPVPGDNQRDPEAATTGTAEALKRETQFV